MSNEGEARLARVLSASIRGVESVRIRVEVDVAPDLPAFSLVGLPSAGIREARERIGAALRYAGFRWPSGRITVNLAPAELRKEGAALDLAIATAILLASGQLRRPPAAWLRSTLFVAELSLDGALRTPRGLAAFALDARQMGIRRLVVPAAAASLLESMAGIVCLPVHSLSELPDAMGRSPQLPRELPPSPPRTDSGSSLRQLRGQARGLRLVAIAAAGRHPCCLMGPPGCGKTLLARAMWALLPPLAVDEWRERLRIESCQGQELDMSAAWQPPIRSPHHSVTAAGLLGGGRPFRPGEITLAHRGVLFLDEATEFAPRLLDLLREPLEAGRLELSRHAETAVLPASFQLILAANPCPCGYLNSRVRSCRCTNPQRRRYLARLSGPLRDRIDLWLELDRVPARELMAEDNPVDVRALRARVEEVRRRVDEVGSAANSQSDLSAALREFLIEAAEKLQLSARATVAVRRVAQSIAWLDGRDAIEEVDLAEACAYRPPASGAAED